MILLAFTLFVLAIIHTIYFYIVHTKRNLSGEKVLIAGRNGSLFRTGSSILAKHLIFELATQGCNLVLVDTAENETSLKDLKKEIEERTNANCSIFVADVAEVSSTTAPTIKGAAPPISNAASSSISSSLETLPSKTGEIDILINVPSHLNISSRSKNSNSKNHLNLIDVYSANSKQMQVVSFVGATGVFGLLGSNYFDHGDDQTNNNIITNNLTRKSFLEEIADNSALVGIAEALSAKSCALTSTMVCSSLLDKIRHSEDYVDTNTLEKIDDELFQLALRSIEGIKRRENRIFVPWSIWFSQILKVFPTRWMEKLLDRIHGKKTKVKGTLHVKKE